MAMELETLETSRLTLTGLTQEDMTFIFGNYSKPEIKSILGHQSEEAYQKEANKQKNGYSSYNRRFKLFLMTEKASGNIIGRCGIHNWNADHRRAEIGYAMEIEQYKRRGFMTEALGAVIEHGFNTMHLNRIEAIVHIHNIPSLRLLEKYHFVQEGVLKQHYFTGDHFEDSLLFAKLKP